MFVCPKGVPAEEDSTSFENFFQFPIFPENVLESLNAGHALGGWALSTLSLIFCVHFLLGQITSSVVKTSLRTLDMRMQSQGSVESSSEV